MMPRKVVRAAFASPSSESELAIFNIASGAFESSGQELTTRCCAVIADL